MKRMRYAVTTIFSALIILLIVLVSPSFAQELHAIKKLAVAHSDFPANTEYSMKRERHFRSVLANALLDFEIALVEGTDVPEAVLHTECSEEIVLDGVQPNPPKYFYKFEIRATNKQLLWRTAFQIRTSAGEEVADLNACHKLAERLSKAIEKAKKGQIKRNKR